MKKFKLVSLVLIAGIFFSSCSSEETLQPETQAKSMLKEFKVKRDMSGAYSLDFNLIDNAIVDKKYNLENNSTQFEIYPTNTETEKSYSKNLEIQNDKFNIGFIDNDTPRNITVIDDDITFLSKGTRNLKSYDVALNEDGTYTLDFKVRNNIMVDFVYNEDESAYEIHLANGKSKQRDFSRTFDKNADEKLTIVFVNHNGNRAKGDFIPIRKPIIIIDDGENG